MAEVGQVVDGRYRLEELIGRGGMGLVFRARHVFTHQQVALKLITDGLDADAMQRFLAEARAASTIGHPAIVEVSDANKSPEGQLYLVMELLAGKPLRIAMSRGLTADDVKRIGLELLDALAAAHARGVIHRDLKPENIYLVAPTGALKVLDFGIAKVLGTSGTTDRRILGTLEYMAPEQLLDSAAVDGRADLWAVGVILYELVTGVRPYAGLTREELFDALAYREPTPITAVATVSPELAAFFASALARDPAARFQTAHQMTAALRWLTFATGVATIGRAAVPPGTQASGTVAPLERARSSSAPPGPTMGTGAAWIRPVSSPPSDEPRASSQRTSTPPGPTLGTGDAWIRPVSQPPGDSGPARAAPGSIPPANVVRSSPDAFVSTAVQQMPVAPPAQRSNRSLVLGVGAVVVIGAAIAIGVIAGSSRSQRGRSDVVVVAGGNARCTAGCKKLEGCGLAQATCVADCDRNLLKADCIEAAADCTAASSCIWQATCGRAADGPLTCAETLGCHGSCKSPTSACTCGCNLQMNPKASLLMGRLFTCHENNPDNDQFKKHCMETAVDCQNDQPTTVSQLPGRPIVKPSSGSCKATCDRLAKCDLAVATCAHDCEHGKLDMPCLDAATTCGDRARCFWNQECGRAVKTGTQSCTEAVQCWGKHAADPIADQCSTCYDNMSPRATLDFGRYYACMKSISLELSADPKFDAGKAHNERCNPLMMACYQIKPTP